MTKSITKSQLATVMAVSKTTLQKYMNKTHYNKLLELGYEKHSNIINGKVLLYLMDTYCLVEEDFN